MFFYVYQTIKQSIRIRRQASCVQIVFDYKDGIYSDFYINIYRELKNRPETSDKVIVAFSLNNPQWFLDERFEREDFVPESLLRFLDSFVLVAATIVEPKKLRENPHASKVQILHGFSSFGTAFGKEFVEGFARILLLSPFQRQQLEAKEFSQYISSERLVSVGLPKIDGPIEGVRNTPRSSKTRSIFYGPTYHIDISSIFEFLDPLVEYATRNAIQLNIKLHPLLYKKYNYAFSGGIDWQKKFFQLSLEKPLVKLLRPNVAFEEVRKLFLETDYFVTDTSGLGYEFALITGRPVVFLGTKLKIPLEDLRVGNPSKYQEAPEIKYRGVIGPIITSAETLEFELDAFLQRYDDYCKKVEDFRKTFTYNLGNAAPVAADAILELYDEVVSGIA